jgi:hypothetical protein
MTARTILKRIHLVATMWFAACTVYLLAAVLRQVGLQWWLVFSLSGYSALMLLLLVSLYLFAIFRNAGRARANEIEHPLTSTHYYLGFYVSAPLLGGLAGVVGMAGVPGIGRFLFGVALGTLGTTFLVWVLLDPLVGMIEMLLPDSRKHRAERLR